MADTNIREQYHECFLPLGDVYQLGGTSVFRHLSRRVSGEKNLVVVPLSLSDQLEELSKENFSGADDALQFLSNLRDKPFRRKQNLLVREVGEGLDILFIENKDIQASNLNLGSLNKPLQEVWGNQSGRSIKVITNAGSDIIKYDVRGIQAERPKFLQVSQDIVHEGIVPGPDELYARLLEAPNTTLSLEEALDLFGSNGGLSEVREELHLNQFVRFRRDNGAAYARVEGKIKRHGDGKIISVSDLKLRLLHPSEDSKHVSVGGYKMQTVLGITPKDMEQYIAVQYGLLNPDVTLSFLCGSQGSGKTLLSYVAAVDQVLWYDKDIRKRRMPNVSENHKGGQYQQIVLLKPNDILGGKSRDVGFLPGSLYDKLRPHLGPYIDAHRESDLRSLFPFEDILRHPRWGNEIFSEVRSDAASKCKIGGVAHLPGDMEVVQMTYSGHMRGRSFRDTLILLDEAQNFTPYEVKTILERMGPGCKAVVMGDPKQVDNPLCTREINGLTHAIAHFYDEPFAQLVMLPHHYRSQVSEVAGKWKVYAQ